MIIIDRDNGMKKRMDERPFEIVERKGDGHPDTICDSVVNFCASRLSDAYIQQCGQPQHFNLDKAFLIAGKSSPEIGSFKRLDEPMRFLIGDRATEFPRNSVNDWIKNWATDWFYDNIVHIEAEDFIIEPVTKGGSAILASVFDNKYKIGANDTSATVGYAPMSRLENTVHSIENILRTLRTREKSIGEDIKIMAVRDKDRVDVTIAMAMVAGELSSVDDYIEVKNVAHGLVVEGLRDWKSANIIINALDNYEKGEDGLYLTNIGISAESGDSGQVGRGNNPLGVIPLNRPMSSEAEAGKNANSHVGKIYNRLCFNIADKIYGQTGYENYIWMVSRIGKPVDAPQYVYIELVDGTCATNDTLYVVDAIVSDTIENWKDIEYFC